MQRCPKKIKRLKKHDDYLYVGDELQILQWSYEGKYHANFVIIEILDKGLYNMYLCKNTKTGCRTTFTDMDIGRSQRVKNEKKLIIEVEYDERELLQASRKNVL